MSKHPAVKKFLYSEDGVTIYESLSFDLKAKGIPTLHLYDKDGEELHSQVLADFSVDEIHKLVYSLGFNRKSDEQLAEETQQNLKQIQEAHADWKRMIASPKSREVKIS